MESLLSVNLKRLLCDYTVDFHRPRHIMYYICIIIMLSFCSGATSRRAYFPKGRWYSLYHGEMVVSSHSGAFLTLNAPIDIIHVRQLLAQL